MATAVVKVEFLVTVLAGFDYRRFYAACGRVRNAASLPVKNRVESRRALRWDSGGEPFEKTKMSCPADRGCALRFGS
jgi:drug/metabolite transporter superfamily protein YnfA